MPTWNAESNSKLLSAIMQQLRDKQIKLDYPKLCTHVGDGCTVAAVRGYMNRQAKIADAISPLQGENDNENLPTPSPQKRAKRGPYGSRAQKSPKTPRTPKKRRLEKVASEDEVDPETEVKNEIDDLALDFVKSEDHESETGIKDEIQDDHGISAFDSETEEHCGVASPVDGETSQAAQTQLEGLYQKPEDDDI